MVNGDVSTSLPFFRSEFVLHITLTTLSDILYLQCGAAISQVCPESPIFRLPAFINNDVKNWMKTEFPKNLALLKSQAGDPIEIEPIQNDLLRQALNNMSAADKDAQREA